MLGDPAWASGPAPHRVLADRAREGAPASERTEVRIVYTADTLYFGVVCRDSDPAGIVVNGSRRDSPLEETDAFQIVLDTYRDRQNGFVFGTNPTGLEYDGQVTNEGQGGGASAPGGAGGSLTGFNQNWDGAWTVKARSGDFGWSAEFAIPFTTLRYDREAAASGASTSSATSAAATSSRSGRRCPASTTSSASRARARSPASSRRPSATSSCCPTCSPRRPRARRSARTARRPPTSAATSSGA